MINKYFSTAAQRGGKRTGSRDVCEGREENSVANLRRLRTTHSKRILNLATLGLLVSLPLLFAGCASPTTAAKPGQRGPIVLRNDESFTTTETFRPPVAITIVAKTDLTNLRIGYAADQVIFNWELNPDQLRVDGGPADGQHKDGAGRIPPGKFVTIRWLVTPTQQAIYVDDELRFEHTGDYSKLDRSVSVFTAKGSTVTVKSIQIEPLTTTNLLDLKAKPVKAEGISAKQIRKWIAQLADPDFSQRDTAVTLLAQHADDALPALKQALAKTGDEERRWWLKSAIQTCEKQQAKIETIAN